MPVDDSPPDAMPAFDPIDLDKWGPAGKKAEDSEAKSNMSEAEQNHMGQLRDELAEAYKRVESEGAKSRCVALEEVQRRRRGMSGADFDRWLREEVIDAQREVSAGG